jgi:hypothetical protein
MSIKRMRRRLPGGGAAEQTSAAAESAGKDAEEIRRAAERDAERIRSETTASAERLLERINALEQPLVELVSSLRQESEGIRSATESASAPPASPDEVSVEPAPDTPDTPDTPEDPGPSPDQETAHSSNGETTAPEAAQSGGLFRRLRRRRGEFISEPGHCAVCNRTFSADSEESLQASGWRVSGDVGLCPPCQSEGWKLPEGARLPYRGASA